MIFNPNHKVSKLLCSFLKEWDLSVFMKLLYQLHLLILLESNSLQGPLLYILFYTQVNTWILDQDKVRVVVKYNRIGIKL